MSEHSQKFNCFLHSWQNLTYTFEYIFLFLDFDPMIYILNHQERILWMDPGVTIITSKNIFNVHNDIDYFTDHFCLFR